jgi:predicted transcriptional regulator
MTNIEQGVLLIKMLSAVMDDMAREIADLKAINEQHRKINGELREENKKGGKNEAV